MDGDFSKFSVAGADSTNASGLSISAPSPFEVFQRNAISNANITISGNVGSGTHDLEARFAQRTWTAVATAASGAYSVTLSNQLQGQGFIQVRLADSPNTVASIENVGVGEVFVIAGQSNASGRGDKESTGDYPTPQVVLFGNDYVWKLCTDPTDTSLRQVDSVSSDAASPAGSWIPILGGQIAGNLNVPVAFIPCALGATSITVWEPSGAHTNRSSLYGSMVWRSAHAIPGGYRAVLWWQGETDAFNGMVQNTYYTNYTNFSAQVVIDTGSKVMPCKLQHADLYSDPAQAEINNAIGQAWSNDPNTLTGPDLTGINTEPESNVHLITSAKLGSASTLWFNAIKAAFSW